MSQVEDVVVTGGAGFVGSHVAQYYAEQEADVTVLDNLSRFETLSSDDRSLGGRRYNWRFLEDNFPEIRLVEGDIRDLTLLRETIEGSDAVVHTAGQVAVTSSLEDPRNDFEVNTLGGFNVVEACRMAESDPAVVFASTNKVYGENVNKIEKEEQKTRYWFADKEFDEGIPETLSIDQTKHTPYGTSKLAADLYFQDYAERNEIKAAVFRMSCIYGPRQFGNEDQGWVAHFTLSGLRQEPLTIFGDGKQVRDVLYVDDLVRAYDAFLTDPSAEPVVYNIGGGPQHTTSLLEFVDLLERQYDLNMSVSFEDWREGDQRVYCSDISRAKNHLDWNPSVSFEDGIDRYVEWYENLDIKSIK